MTTINANADLATLTTLDHASAAAKKTPTAVRVMTWTGRVLTGLITAFMLLDGAMKLAKPKVVVEGTMQMGYAESVIIPLGVTLLIATILYAIPRTAILGAILLTGYLGGAVDAHVRAGDGQFFWAVIFGVVAWLGLYFRDARLRSLVPLRRD